MGGSYGRTKPSKEKKLKDKSRESYRKRNGEYYKGKWRDYKQNPVLKWLSEYERKKEGSK